MFNPETILAGLAFVAAYAGFLWALTRLFSCAVDPEEDA
jgi:hypothetical protein